MVEGELSTALAVLRVVRGWTQEDLAEASGVRVSSLSEYERGKKIPELKTLRRITGAMGYPLAVVERAQNFVYSLRAESLLAEGQRVESGRQPATSEPVSLDAFIENSAVFKWEIEEASAEAGRVVSRLARLMLVLLSRPELEPPDGGNGEHPS